MAYAFGVGLFAVITQYHEMHLYAGADPHIDNVFFFNCIFMPIVAAVFVGLFIGTEYSDGTIRNKLIVGQTRFSVYFSNLIVCVAALLLMHIVNIAVIAAIGLPLIGNVEMPVRFLVMLGLISMVTVTALAAIFLLMGMLIHNKAVGSVAAIILSIVFLLSAMTINASLEQPEYYEAYSYTYTDKDGKTHEEHEERSKNPLYLEGSKRKVYEFLSDALPGGQMVQISGQKNVDPVKLPLYSLSIIAAATAFGVFFFSRKNIK